MAPLNYNHLRYFREVAREGNLTRAAERLAVSQSALSTQIRTLEERLGHPLFERIGRHLVLTEAGRIALEHADAIFAVGDDLLATLKAGTGTRRLLKVGALATLSRNFQIEFLRPCLGRPDIEIVLTSGSLSELQGALKQLDLDVVLCNQPPQGAESEGLIAQRLAEQPISLVAAPLLHCTASTPKEALTRHPVILPTGDTGLRAEFDALCQRLGVTPSIVAEVDDMAMLRLMAREAIGLAPLPAIVVRDELQAGTLSEVVALPQISERFYALTMPRQFPNPVVSELIAAAASWAS
ncbi:LysR family transcriptional regulator [Peteryoungia ipomoeae]|uniref:LysR family transcriptional regulator n=1 Tax=Peteryoungia ipomoeae TaxID=1210932 RepID=A0A4S8NZ56_9HYPH|nr:LysR family transcriptional regulator [Peteryoungia ipomoeae]THV23007.1 LysR family transcriptional regulator [Peteryoungia ipomoeae]